MTKEEILQADETTMLPPDYYKKLCEKNKQCASFRRFLKMEIGSCIVKQYLGTDIYFLREWVESMFTNGMTWQNYGSLWAVDHIVPFRMFDLFNQEDLIICWNYRNLMPLLNSDNTKKQGNVFFALELLHPRKDKDLIYAKLFERIKPEVEWMLKYIDNYDSKPFK